MKGTICKILQLKSVLFTMALLCVFLPFCMNVCAKEDTPQTIIIEYTAGETEFSLYRVADFKENGTFTVVDPFVEYSAKVKGMNSLETLDADGWRKLSVALENLVVGNDLKPISVKKSDLDGMVSWEDVSKGLYLILGKQTKDADYIYTPSPILITVPNIGADGKWDYQVDIKHSKVEKIPLNKKVSLKTIKVWKDTDDRSKRPSEIKVALYKDGKFYERIILNRKNNWKYEWKNLSPGHKWTVLEMNVPDSYQAEYSKEGSCIYIINELEKPDDSEKPKEDKPKGDTQEKENKLPQTGQLWWPVPILAIMGLTAWMIGWLKRRIYKE